MLRTARMLTLALGVLAVAQLGSGRVTAQTVVVSPPGVSYYAPAPAVTYYSYSAPAVSYYSPPAVYAPAPAVSYYYGGTVSYYTPAPAVSYYAPAVSYYAPAAVTTTRYGLFGRPRVSTTYYAPVYVGR
jgi:hypothetical protein